MREPVGKHPGHRLHDGLMIHGKIRQRVDSRSDGPDVHRVSTELRTSRKSVPAHKPRESIVGGNRNPTGSHYLTCEKQCPIAAESKLGADE